VNAFARFASALAGTLLAVVALADDDPVLVGRVTKVHDGDTINVALTSGPIRVRLDGIDAPELKMTAGEASREELSRLVSGKEVALEVQTQDRYGRLVAVVFVGAMNVNARMVEDGHAWAYRQYLRTETRYLCELENDARSRRRGLWSMDAWVYPPEWRKAQRAPGVAFTSFRQETSKACLAAVGTR